MTEHRLTAGLEHRDMRLDRFIAESGVLSRSAAQKLIESGDITLHGRPATKNTRVSPGDLLVIKLPKPVEYKAAAEDIPLHIVYEDDYLLVVNKPKGMVVHPAAGHSSGTLVNALLYHCGDSLSGINGVMRPGIVHRIDKDTSGLLLVAKTDVAHSHLSAQLKSHSISRIYYAVAYGQPKADSGQVNLPIGRHPKERKKMAVLSSGGRAAVTDYEVIERLRGFCVLCLKLQTGRTHQIRVHMSHIGYPLVGDTMYGPSRVITETQGQCLHAATLGFVHPISGEQMLFESELPRYFTTFIQKHRQESVGFER